jgi:hypothetical protein
MPLLGGETRMKKVWNIYKTNQLINPNDDFEVLLFRPGYEGANSSL